MAPESLARARASAQLLHRPAALEDPGEVVRRVAGIQAQDPVAGRLGIRSRSRRITAAAVDRARAEERTLVRVWAMRGTLHLLATEDLAWQVPLYAERELGWARRRMAEGFGIDRRAQDRVSKTVRKMLASDGIVARKAVLDGIAESGLEFDRASVGHHLARLPVLEGFAMLGPERGRETTYVIAEDWVGARRALERPEALAELARRYLAAFGPADDRDMAAWSGLGLGDCRAGLEAIAAEIAEVDVGGQRLWALRTGARRLPRSPLVRLLPAFDNLFLAHADRGFAIEPQDVSRVWPGGGIIRPTVTVDGRAVGTWSTRRAKGRISVSVDSFRPLEQAIEAAIEAEVADVGRFEGLEASSSVRSRAETAEETD